MKKFSIFFLTVVLTAAASAQTPKSKEDETIFKAWNDYLARVKKEKKPNDPSSTKQLSQEDPTIKKVQEQLSKEIADRIAGKSKQSGSWSEYTSTRKKSSGEMDLMPMLEEAPMPLYNLPIAGQTDVDAKFDPYIEKVNRQAKDLAQQAQKGNKLDELYKKEGEEGMKKKAMSEADQSVLIQQMGGTEKLMNMSEAERKAAAQKMAQALRQNPGLLTASNQKPSAELMADRDRSKLLMDITQLGIRTQKRLQDVTNQYSENIQLINEWVENVKRKLGNWYSEQYKSIPVVELGEYGHDKDPEKLAALEFAIAYLTYQELQVPEMAMRADAWKIYKTNCKWALAEVNDFAGEYKWGNHAGDKQVFATDADQQAGGAIGAIYGVMEDLAKDAKSQSKTAKGYQQAFEQRMKN